jgi:hypothetical protein
MAVGKWVTQPAANQQPPKLTAVEQIGSLGTKTKHPNEKPTPTARTLQNGGEITERKTTRTNQKNETDDAETDLVAPPPFHATSLPRVLDLQET